MRKSFFVLVALALVSVLLAACGGSPADVVEEVEELVDCSSSAYTAIAGELLKEWEGIIKVTLTRFPGNLEPSINDLTRILGEFKALEIPACYQEAHEKNLSAMQLELEGVKEFDSTGNVADQFDQADEIYAEALEVLNKLDQ